MHFAFTKCWAKAFISGCLFTHFSVVLSRICFPAPRPRWSQIIVAAVLAAKVNGGMPTWRLWVPCTCRWGGFSGKPCAILDGFLKHFFVALSLKFKISLLEDRTWNKLIATCDWKIFQKNLWILKPDQSSNPFPFFLFRKNPSRHRLTSDSVSSQCLHWKIGSWTNQCWSTVRET